MPKKIEEVKEKKPKKEAKKEVTKKATAKKTTTKKTTTKKATTKTTTTKKTTTKAKTTKKASDEKVKKTRTRKTSKKEVIQKPEFIQEYYDLPYRYNETIVTILAQTPKKLFVYWDISDNDREAFQKAFGNDFFDKTYPVLLVHNEELNYTFEVPINDFANSWYLDVPDSRTNYMVQLGRKFKSQDLVNQVNLNLVREENINLQNDYIYITDSNKLEIPNDHILFELLSNQIKYRNVKNGREFTKELKNLLNDIANTYSVNNLHELYTKLYEEEIAKEEFGRRNPGSEEFGLPTSSQGFQGF